MSNNPFGNLSNEGLEEAQDRLGGYSVLDTDIYTGIIKYMYAGESAKGAKSVSISVDFQGREYRETIYVTNKNGENFYKSKDSDKKQPLPGFTVINDMILATIGESLSTTKIEEKVLKLYDFDEKKELPKSVPVLVDMTGQEVSMAIVKRLENKTEKGSDGEYHPIADTRETNTIEKVFNTATKLTVYEATNSKPAEFWEKWETKNKGIMQDRRELKDGEGGKTGAPPKAGDTAQAPRKSLFGK